MSVVIGITGGVGCGKSTVLNILKDKYNASVIEADKVGHIVMEPGTLAYNKIIRLFGNEVLEKSDSSSLPPINRKALSEIVFNDNMKLEQLDNIIHPAVKEYIKEFIAVEKEKKTKYIIVEAALLIEAGYRDICDTFWYIYADREIRINRLIDSRGYSLEKIDSIMKSQLSDEEFINGTDTIINNNLDYDNLVFEIQNKIKNIST